MPTTPVSSFWRRLLFRACAVLLGVGLAGAAVEISVRVANLPPRTQIIRADSIHLSTIDGVPVWEQTTDRQHTACVARHPDATRILLFGASITYGSGVEANQTFSSLLEDALNAAAPRPGYCVLNFAQPGFTFAAKFALARREVTRLRPALVLWEDWEGEDADYTMLGDVAYKLNRIRLDGRGYPALPLVPSVVNAWLFRNSRAWERAAIAQNVLPPGEVSAAAFVRDRLSQVPVLARSVGGRVMFYLCPFLDRDFATSVRWPLYWMNDVQALARSVGAPSFQLAEDLVGEDVRAVRLDECCHYNAAGHRLLAAAFARRVRALLGPAPAGGPSPGP